MTKLAFYLYIRTFMVNTEEKKLQSYASNSVEAKLGMNFREQNFHSRESEIPGILGQSRDISRK